MKTVKKIFTLLRPYIALIVLSLALSGAGVVLTLLIPVLAGEAIDLLAGKGSVDFAALMPQLLKIAALSLALAVCGWCAGVINNRISFACVRDLRDKAFARVCELPLSYLDTHPAGGTLNRIIADADQLADGLLMGFSQLFSGVLTIAGTLVILFSRNAGVALAVVLVTPLSLFAASFIARRTHRYFRSQTQARSAQTALIDEMVGERRTVLAMGMENVAKSRFEDANEAMRKASLLATFYSSITNPTTRFVNNIVYALACLFGALAVPGGTLTVGGLSTLLAYATQYTKPFNEISGVLTELQNALACADNIFALIDAPSDTPDGEKTLEGAQGAVTLSGVDFSYTPHKKLIRDLSLDVRPGMRVAIVGPTGCGKTTLINLLMRFYDVGAGSICVDGADIRTLTRKSLRTSYGMVLQQTWLKGGTVRENIAMGRPDATPEEIEQAAREAHAHSFIKRLPCGYDTVIGEDGGVLSAGQKQFLCIARVMLTSPPMLILDEATSSIDTRTERRIQSAFAAMMEGKTSFIVAHRLSTVKNADLILVMKDGDIIERGTHESLLAAGGFYHTLYNSQFAK